MGATIAIVGRPNVGKSTLFNRLVGRRSALVHNQPGVTRDWREGEGQLADLIFRLLDTAGLEETDGRSLAARSQQQTEMALAQADIVLLLIDARAGVTPVDAHFAGWLRRFDKAVLLVANKCEGNAGAVGLAEGHALGLGEPIPFSAEHGDGMGLLYDAIAPLLEALGVAAGEDGDADAAETTLRLAIVGRPNVGKSTLVNALLGHERVVTGPESGITRDAIAIAWRHDGRKIELIDTAGLRRRARVTEKLEKLAVDDTQRAIRFAHVVALVLDATELLERQDLGIASQVVDEGRALVIIMTKWDLVDQKTEAMKGIHDRLLRSLPQVRGLPVVTLSGLTGQNLERLMPAVVQAYDVWNKRIPTGALNTWLAEALAYHPPPLSSLKRRLRIRYATQAKARPPTFVLFTNRPSELADSYRRYLENGLRDRFGLEGTPIRLTLRKGENPYSGKAGASKKGATKKRGAKKGGAGARATPKRRGQAGRGA